MTVKIGPLAAPTGLVATTSPAMVTAAMASTAIPRLTRLVVVDVVPFAVAVMARPLTSAGNCQLKCQWIRPMRFRASTYVYYAANLFYRGE
jgi:hypothetical protein